MRLRLLYPPPGAPDRFPQFCWACTRKWKTGDTAIKFGNDWICARCYGKASRAIYVPNRLLSRHYLDVFTEDP